jgi:hypothetical protein
MTTISGIYRQGKIELIEPPVGLREGPVRVFLIEEEIKNKLCLLTFGKYQSGELSTPESFAEAECRGKEFP